MLAPGMTAHDLYTSGLQQRCAPAGLDLGVGHQLLRPTPEESAMLDAMDKTGTSLCDLPATNGLLPVRSSGAARMKLRNTSSIG